MASVLKPMERWLKLAVLPPGGAAVIRALGRSMKIETRGHEHVDRLYREGKREKILRALGSLHGAVSLVSRPLPAGVALVGPAGRRCGRVGSQTPGARSAFE